MQRNAVASDTNGVTYCLTHAKVDAPVLGSVLLRIRQLRDKYDGRAVAAEQKHYSEFLRWVYTRDVFLRLLYLRRNLRWRNSRVDRMIAALALGALHGEMDKSISYLSNQMPRTISTKPDYSVRYWKSRGLKPPERDVFYLFENRARFRYSSPRPSGDSHVFHSDMRELPSKLERKGISLRCSVTSPPYFDVTSFEEDQWLRLWFLGGTSSPSSGLISSDDRHALEGKYWSFIADMWRTLGALIGPNGDVVLRMGSRRINPSALRRGVVGCAQFSYRKTELVEFSLSEIWGRQTNSFRPGTKGCVMEVDMHFHFSD